MDKLQELSLGGTSIEALPLSLDHLKGLETIYMCNCKSLPHLPETLSNLKALRSCCLSNHSKLKRLPGRLYSEEHRAIKYEGQDYENFSLGPLVGASSLTFLDVSCGLWQLPADIGRLSSLKQLELQGGNFEMIPASIKQLSVLNGLDIRNCQMLQSLPELPPSLLSIRANGCRSLKTVYALKQLLLESEQLYHHFQLSNCFKLDQDECGALANAKLRNPHFANGVFKYMGDRPMPSFLAFYPGSDIPECFNYQSVGHSVGIQLPLNWRNDGFLGLCSMPCT